MSKDSKPGALGRGSVWLCWAVASSLTIGLSWQGQAKSKRSSTVVALFLIAEKGPPPALVAGLKEAVDKFDQDVRAIEMVSSTALKKRIRRKPAAAIGACGSNLACIARLARKARAASVLYVRALPSTTNPGGLVAQFLLVGAKSKAIDGKAMLEFTLPGEIKARVFAELARILGVKIPSPAPAAHVANADDTAPEGEDLPLADLTAPHEGETPAADGKAETEEILAAGALAAGAQASTAESPPEEVPSKAAKSAPRIGGLTALGWPGAAAALLGVTAAGVGGYYAYKGKAMHDSLRYCTEGNATDCDTQTEGEQKQKQGNRLYGRANIFFGLGGGVALIGAALVVVDLVWLEDDNASVSASVAPGEVQSRITFRW